MARPRLITPDLVERAAELRRDGFTVAVIAERLDVSKRTTQRALARTRETRGDTPQEVSPRRAASIDGSADASIDPVVPLGNEAAVVARITRICTALTCALDTALAARAPRTSRRSPHGRPQRAG